MLWLSVNHYIIWQESKSSWFRPSLAILKPHPGNLIYNTDISFEDHILNVYLENVLLLPPSLCICFMATAISKRGRNTIALLLKQIVV